MQRGVGASSWKITIEQRCWLRRRVDRMINLDTISTVIPGIFPSNVFYFP